MTVTLLVRNESARKRLYRKDSLAKLAERILATESFKRDAELSLLFCDDSFIQNLNKQYRGKNAPTDVLAFSQGHSRHDHMEVLGDIVISLETVERQCAGDRDSMRKELRLLFCHGLLHLLGYDHATAQARASMTAKQAEALGVSPEAAWMKDPGKHPSSPGAAHTGG